MTAIYVCPVESLVTVVDDLLKESTDFASYSMAWRALLAIKGYGADRGDYYTTTYERSPQNVIHTVHCKQIFMI